MIAYRRMSLERLAELPLWQSEFDTENLDEGIY
jgi:hypothetical protein